MYLLPQVSSFHFLRDNIALSRENLPWFSQYFNGRIRQERLSRSAIQIDQKHDIKYKINNKRYVSVTIKNVATVRKKLRLQETYYNCKKNGTSLKVLIPKT